MRVSLLMLLLVALLLGSCRGDSREDGDMAPPPPVSTPLTVTLTRVATGLAAPTYITHAGDARLFLVEQPGRIRIVAQGTLLATPFLDLTPLVGSGAIVSGSMFAGGRSFER